MKTNKFNEKCNIPNEKESNKVYKINEAIWEVSGGFNWVSKGTKYEGKI